MIARAFAKNEEEIVQQFPEVKMDGYEQEALKLMSDEPKEIIDEVKESISKWKLFASIANVSQQSSKMIHTHLSHR